MPDPLYGLRILDVYSREVARHIDEAVIKSPARKVESMPTQTQAQSTIEDLRAVAANGLSGMDKYLVQRAIDLLTEFATGELAYASAADILELRRASLISEDEAREALGLSPRKAPVATTPAAKFADEVRDASVAGAKAAISIETK